MGNDSNSGYMINYNQWHESIETWIPNEREGYRLYAVEDLDARDNYEYALVKYTWSNKTGELLAIGGVEINVENINREKVDEAFENEETTELTDEQWKVVEEAYEKLSRRVLRNIIFEGIPQLYKQAVYHEIEEFGDAMRQKIDEIHRKIKKHDELKEKEDRKNHYEEYAEYSRLGDDQYYNIELIEEGLNWEHSDIVPYAQHCQVAALLEFDMYEDWEMRALEHLHSGVFINKPELAKTKALLEDGLTPSEIAEKLGKHISTVSRQVSQVENWEKRATWQSKR